MTLRWQPALALVWRYVYALGLGMAVVGLIVAMQHESPWQTYGVLAHSTFGSVTDTLYTLRWATPQILAGLACAVGFSAGVFNIGVEGQLYLGAFVAGVLGYTLHLPPLLHVLVCTAGGALAGALYALIPAALLVFWGINEVVVTLMLNYVAMLGTQYVTRVDIMGPAATSASVLQTPPVLVSAQLPQLVPGVSVNAGLYIALGVAGLLWIVLYRTRFGFNAVALSQSLRFAAFAGAPVRRVQLYAFLMSGALAGLVGVTEILGVDHRFIAGFSQNVGFSGIMVALMANNNPLGVLFTGLLFGSLSNGSLALARETNLNSHVIMLIEGLVILFFTVNLQQLRTRMSSIWRRPTA